LNTNVAEISILLVGSTDRLEFRQARAVLDTLGEVAATDAESACLALERGQVTPDVIVLAQAYPGQFSTEAVDRVRRLAPLARVVGLLGSWCEGETRSGQPWPAALRVYWHQWPAQAGQEMARVRAGTCPTWSLPITASEEERLLLLAEEPIAKREGLIVLWTPDFEMQDWLGAACARRGYSTAWFLPHRPVPAEQATAAVFDGNECRGEERSSLEQLADALGPVPIVALLDFPRVDGRDRALAAGAQAVLSKPFLIDDLFWQIDRLLKGRAAAPQQ
jgi:CheY-like chemotaxis protein